MRTYNRLFMLALAISMVGGCDDTWGDDDAHTCVPAPSPVEDADGALALGRFRWACVNSGDPTCGSGNFPYAVAMGARFNLDFSTDSDVPDSVGDPELSAIGNALVRTGAAFSAPVPGVATVVAVSDEAAIDFIELEVQPVTLLTLSRTLPPPPTDEWGCTSREPPPTEGGRPDLEVGESANVQAMPYAGSTRLGGSLEYSWESLTPQIVGVSSGAGRFARLDGLTEGVGRVVVRGGDHEETFEIRVDAPPPTSEPETGSDDETGAGGDGTGSTSGGEEGTTGESSSGGEDETSGGEDESTTGGGDEETDTDGTSGGAT